MFSDSKYKGKLATPYNLYINDITANPFSQLFENDATLLPSHLLQIYLFYKFILISFKNCSNAS